MRRAILLAAVLSLVASGTVLAGDPAISSGSRLVAGGGRIWEGTGLASATADITFAGITSRVGPGTTPADYRCDWQVHFKNVGVDWLDGVTARTTGCGAVVVIPMSSSEGRVRCSAMPVLLDGEPGYVLSLVLEDGGEPGRLDLVHVVLRTDVPREVVYDTIEDFGTALAALDAGNIQAWIEP